MVCFQQRLLSRWQFRWFAQAAPLRVNPANPRYFIDGAGKAIYLTGSHTWANLQDNGGGVGGSNSNPPPVFDYNGYLNLMQSNGHNFMRMWRWEFPKTAAPSYSEPHPWLRTGPGNSADGKLKFDLNRFNQAYFDRLRSRVIAAGNKGIYVDIMLFEGWVIKGSPTSWAYHPFNKNNNISGINGDLNNNGNGEETHSLQSATITNIQKAYIRKVIDTVNDLDNVLYEIANESGVTGSKEWQYNLINYIKSYQAGKPKKHPVGDPAGMGY